MSKPKSLNFELMFPIKHRKANIFWPVYVNLEKEFMLLSFNIFIDDNQLNTYSYKISELILRAAIEIESISKELYLREGGEAKRQLTYDDALKYLDRKWNLNKKILKINSSNVHITETNLKPFSKVLDKRKNKRHYRWNISYQNIKHDRGKFIKEASVQNLLYILSALFILNLYYNDEEFELDEDSSGKTLYSKLDTELFAVSIHRNQGINQFNEQNKREGYDESLYYVVFDNLSRDRLIKAIEDMLQNIKQHIPKDSAFDKFRDAKHIMEIYGNTELESKIGKEKLHEIISISSAGLVNSMQKLKSIARLNKNDL